MRFTLCHVDMLILVVDYNIMACCLQVKEEGYEVEHGGYCITVFSAPNYCDQMGNKGAYIRFSGRDMTPQFQTFAAVDHPSVKPMAYANPFMGSMFGA